MRNSKVKSLKKTTLLTLSLLLIAAGATVSYAQSWSDVETSVNNATSGSTVSLGNDVTATSTLTPPVPININGNNHTIDGTGYNGSIVGNSGTNTTITNTSIKNASLTSAEGFTNGGAAIHNENGNVTVTSTSASHPAEFSGNTAVNGGAILSTGTSKLNISNTNFTNNTATAATGTNVAYGGAIYNGSTTTGTQADPNLSLSNVTFTGNRADMTGGGYGGALHHNFGVANISNTTFMSNHATSEGGAISNRADIYITNSTFDSNAANSQGGAITNGFASSTNPIDANIYIKNTLFQNNHTGSSGGAIFNKVSLNDSANPDNNTTHTIYIQEGTKFINNYVSAGTNVTGSGAAILNDGALSADRQDAKLIITGGNTDATKVLFQNNIAGNGGAIYNRGEASIKNAKFDSNGISPDNTSINANSMTSNGGAIYNTRNNYTSGSENYHSSGSLTVENTTFINNRVSGNGGAIFNASQATIIDSDFENNGAGNTGGHPVLSNGGAIYTNATMNDPNATTTIIARNRDINIGTKNSIANQTDSVVFHGNGSNVATGNFLASNGRTINIHSEVRGSNSDTTVINFGDTTGNNAGTVKFHGDASLSQSTVNIYSGLVGFDHDRGFDGSNILNMYGGTLDLLNGEYGPHQLRAKEFNLLGDATLKLDVDLANLRMDGIYEGTDPNTGETYIGTVTNPGGNYLTVDTLYAQTDSRETSAEVLFTNAPALMGHVIQGEGAKIVQSPTTKYEVTKYEITGDPTREDGVYFGFTRKGVSDPAISGPVAAQAAYIMMDNLYRQSFANMDMVALMTPEQREMIKALRCGNNRIDWKREKGYVTGVFAPNTVPEERDGLYVRPFANFENMPLKNGPRVSNVFYGSLIGGESDLVDIGHGWDATYSFFGAYHGSHQAYNGVDIWQNGGSLGAVGTVYKGRFFSGLTANVGASAAEARHGFGNDQFPILMAGAAWKSGYNLGMFTNKLILQPSYMMSYTFVNVFDYNSASGARISQDPLNAIEIIPGLKLIGNFKNGWQPYIGANVTWNIMDKTKFQANDVMLPQLSVKPFVEYGLGLQKRYGDRFTGYGQAMFRSGGRNGVAFTLGMRWALGN